MNAHHEQLCMHPPLPFFFHILACHVHEAPVRVGLNFGVRARVGDLASPDFAGKLYEDTGTPGGLVAVAIAHALALAAAVAVASDASGGHATRSSRSACSSADASPSAAPPSTWPRSCSAPWPPRCF